MSGQYPQHWSPRFPGPSPPPRFGPGPMMYQHSYFQQNHGFPMTPPASNYHGYPGQPPKRLRFDEYVRPTQPSYNPVQMGQEYNQYVHDLEQRVENLGNLLKSRGQEISTLNSKIEVLECQIRNKKMNKNKGVNDNLEEKNKKLEVELTDLKTKYHESTIENTKFMLKIQDLENSKLTNTDSIKNCANCVRYEEKLIGIQQEKIDELVSAQAKITEMKKNFEKQGKSSQVTNANILKKLAEAEALNQKYEGQILRDIQSTSKNDAGYKAKIESLEADLDLEKKLRTEAEVRAKALSNKLEENISYFKGELTCEKKMKGVLKEKLEIAVKKVKDWEAWSVDMKSAKSQVSGLQGQLKLINKQFKEQESEKMEAQDNLSKSEVKIKNLEEELENTKFQVVGLQAQLKLTNKQFKDHESEKLEAQENLDKAESKNKSLESKLEKEIAKREKQAEDSKSFETKLETTQEEMKNLREQLQALIKDGQDKIKMLEKKLEDKERIIKELKLKKDAKNIGGQDKIAILEKKLEAKTQEFDELKKDRTEIFINLKDANQKCKNLETKNFQIVNHSNELNKKLHELQKEVTRLKNNSETKQNEMKNVQENLKNLKAENELLVLNSSKVTDTNQTLEAEIEKLKKEEEELREKMKNVFHEQFRNEAKTKEIRNEYRKIVQDLNSEKCKLEQELVNVNAKCIQLEVSLAEQVVKSKPKMGIIKVRPDSELKAKSSSKVQLDPRWEQDQIESKIEMVEVEDEWDPLGPSPPPPPPPKASSSEHSTNVITVQFGQNPKKMELDPRWES